MADNPYMTVASPSYGAPLVNLFGSAQQGMGLGQAARRGVQNLQGLFNQQPQQSQQPWQQPGTQPPATANMFQPGAAGAVARGMQFPQGGQQPPQPPQYARNLGQIFGITPGGPSPGAQSPTQWNGAPSPNTNFDFSPGA